MNPTATPPQESPPLRLLLVAAAQSSAAAQPPAAARPSAAQPAAQEGLRARLDAIATVFQVEAPGPLLDSLLRGRDWDAALIVDPATAEGAMAAVHDLQPELKVLVVEADEDPDTVSFWRQRGAREVIGRGRLEQLEERLLKALRDPARPSTAMPQPRDTDDAGRLLRVLHTLHQQLDQAMNKDELLQAAARAVSDVTDAPLVEAWRWSDGGAHPQMSVAVADDPAMSELHLGPESDPSPREGVVCQVLEHGHPVTLDDLAADRADPSLAPRMLRLADALALGLRSVHASPVLVGSEAVAALVVHLAEAGDSAGLATVAGRCDWIAAQLGRRMDLLRSVSQGQEAVQLLDVASELGGSSLLACDAEGRLSLVHPAMERAGFAGRRGESASRWTARWSLFEQAGALSVPRGEDPLSRALRGETLDDAFYLSRPDGARERRWQVSARPLTGTDGNVVGALSSWREVVSRADPRVGTDAQEMALRGFRFLLDRAAELAAAVGEAKELDDVWAPLDAFVRATTTASAWRVLRADDVPLASSAGQADAAADAAADGHGSPVLLTPMRVGERLLGHLLLRSSSGSPAFDERQATAANMAANLLAVAVDHADLVVQERLQRERAEVSAQSFRALFQASPAAQSLGALDDDIVLDINSALETMLGRGREMVVDRPPNVRDVWADPDQRGAIRAEVLAGRSVRDREVLLRHADGSLLRCLASAERIEHMGRPAMLMTIVDLTERLAKETELQQLANFREALVDFVEQTLDAGFEAGFYQRLVETAVRATPGAEGGTLVLRDGGDEYRFVAAVGYDLDGLQPVVFRDHEIHSEPDDLGPGIVRLQTDTPDETRERLELLRRHGRLDEIRSTLVVPIVLAGRRVAALFLDSFSDDRAFGETSKGLATAFASQVAALVRRRDLEHELERMAYHDHLTGLPNRLLFRDRLVQSLAAATRHERRGGALFIDLDNLKVTNDTLGHAVGDALLIEVARRLRASVRSEDTVARIGGDEFTVVLPDVADGAAVARVAEKVLAALRRPFELAGHEVHASASIGVTLFPDDAMDADTLIQHGDTAMYQAKTQGKDRFRFFTREMNRALLERASIEAQLRKALERDELSLHYQPRVDLNDGRITSVEALARWEHPERGWIPPSDFIPVAEDAGLLPQVASRLLELSCRQARAWVDQGLDIRMAFNLSAKQLQERDLVQQIEEVLSRTGLPPRFLELELTESAVMRNVEENVGKLAALRDLGVQVAIDDFGTGYSSLNYLKRLPAYALKIDRSFVKDLSEDLSSSPHDAAIVRAIVALARTLEMQAIAEGIETTAQLDFLRQVGCQQGQGFLFARPAAESQIRPLLQAGRVTLPP